nr:protein FAR1-RELATED SEQUENCE 1-like [Aegilops tauschii subsp. strangulata]
MALAIPVAFENTVHKLCRWHIMKKYREHLAYLYNLRETFKDEFTAILNWPLMPTEFEDSWKALMDKYNLHDDARMVAMWNERERWMSAYFKEIFCAKMTSTQWSESMNYVLNKNFTIKAASVLERYILRRYTKSPNIQPTFNRNDLRIVASNKASQYCIESTLLQLNMRVQRKSFRSQDQMARSRFVMERLEQELDAMHSAENGGVADNEAIEQDIATILSDMNHP